MRTVVRMFFALAATSWIALSPAAASIGDQTDDGAPIGAPIPLGVGGTCADIVIDGTLGSGSPDWPSVSGNQTGRLNRNGVASSCAVPKSCNQFDSTPGRAFDAYTISNDSGATQCVTVQLDVLTQAACNLQVDAYSNVFDPANICTNYLADPGLSSGIPPTPTSMSFDIPAGDSFVLDVHTTNPGEIGCLYTLTVQGDVCGGNCFTEDFDAVTPPALPAGWTSSFVNGAANCTPTGTCTQGTNWTTVNTTPDTAPNAAFHNDPSCVTDNYLVSPVIVPTPGQQMTFRNFYNTENTFDGGVLEIRINGGAWTDIVAAGGSFATGGYNGTISASFLSPIAGRQAWTGNAGAYLTTTVNLPAGAIGQNVEFRFRMASDCSVGSNFWRVDTIDLTPCGGGACVITPPTDIVVGNDAGQCGAIVNYPAPTTTGTCGTITCTPPSGGFFPVGTTQITCSETGGASATFNVTVNDVEAPVIACPGNIGVVAPPGALSVPVDYVTPTPTDNCPGVTGSCAPPSGDPFPIGDTVVVCSALDAASNSAACTFLVSVGNQSIQEIPAASSLGLAALALLLAGAAFVALRRQG